MFNVSNLESNDIISLKLDTLYLLKLYTESYVKSLLYLMTCLILSSLFIALVLNWVNGEYSARFISIGPGFNA